MTKILFFMILALLTSCMSRDNSSSLSCTGFCIGEGDKLFVAKSYEWVSDHGALIFNPRGLEKRAVFLKRRLESEVSVLVKWLGKFPTDYKQPARWIAKYNSITFSQAGVLFPIGGINEKGLIVESLTNRGAVPEDFGTNSKAINELQWVSYQLDLYASIDEVVEHIRELSVVFDAAALHHFICERSGQCAVIEYSKDGTLIVTRYGKNEIPLLTNHNLTDLVAHQEKNRNQPLPSLEYASKNSGTASSMDRYRIAFEKLGKLRERQSQLSVNTIADQVLNAVWIEGFTQWNIIYDLSKFDVYIRTAKFRHFRYLKARPLLDGPGCASVPYQYFNLDKLADNSGAPIALVKLSDFQEKTLVRDGIQKVVVPAFRKNALFSASEAHRLGDILVEEFFESSFGPIGIKCRENSLQVPR